MSDKVFQFYLKCSELKNSIYNFLVKLIYGLLLKKLKYFLIIFVGYK